MKENYFFRTTLKRYLFQLKILDTLEKSINSDGAMVEKEYVKGRPSITCNPAIANYNRGVEVANKTVTTLIGIISKLKNQEDDSEEISDILRDTT